MQQVSQVADQATGLRHMAASKPVKVIAVTAGKGGVGKTNVSVNLALALSKMNQSVMLLDADLGLANVDVMLGLHPKQNIEAVMRGECSLQEVIIDGPNGIKIIPASSGTQHLTRLSEREHAGLIDAFSDLDDDLDVLIIDTAAGISDNVISFTRSAQEVVVVVCDEPTSITDAYALIKVMHQQHRIHNFHVLANRVSNSREGKSLFNKLNCVTEQFLHVSLQYLGALSEDEMLRKAVKQQKAVCDVYPGSKVAGDFKKIAQEVNQWPIRSEELGSTRFFIERLLAQ